MEVSNSSIFVDCDLTDEQRRERLYMGDLFVYSKSPATIALIELARELLEKAFAPHHPRDIHHHLGAQEVAAILGVLKPNFIHHPECKVLVRRILEERGVDLDKVYFDVPRMRSAYPPDYLATGIAYAFHPHRDTWYSAPQCQLNWWLPIYPVDPDNAMGFYPRYFAEPLSNSSETYNYYTWNEERTNAAKHIGSDPRVQPKATVDIDRVTFRVLPPPGGLIVFSGAQLHETVANTTPVARYSIDFRTVHLDDASARRGARNIDSRSTGTTMRDYLRATDLQHLPDDVVKMYDDGTEARAATLYFGDRMARS